MSNLSTAANQFSQFKPYARSPLHVFNLPAQARVQDASCGVWMNELPLLAYTVVRGDSKDPAFNQAVFAAIGIVLPTSQSSFALFEQGCAIWQTPDEWLLICSRAVQADYVQKLTEQLAPLHAQVVDNSGGLTTVYISGKNHVDLLRHVGLYDFESIRSGQAVSTVFNKANMVVLRQDEHGLFVIFRRSFADYLWLLLSKAARPYGLGINLLAGSGSAAHPLLNLI